MSTAAAPAIVAAARPASPRRIAVIAATSTFVMAIAGMFANVVLMSLASGGPAGAAARVSEAHLLLRLAIVAFLVVVVLDVVLAWAIARFFGDRHADLARLAGWMRLVYAAVLGAAVGQLPAALAAARSGADDAAHAALLGFGATWQLGLVVFAAHLALLGAIVIRDRATPTFIGVVLVIAAAAYAADGVARLFLPEGAILLNVLVALVTVSSVVGEIGLGVWFLARGGRRR